MTPEKENAPQAPLDPSPTMPVLDALTLAAEWAELDADGCPFPEAKADYLSAAASLRALADALPSAKALLHGADRCEDDFNSFYNSPHKDEAALAERCGADCDALRALAQVLGEAPRS